MILIALGSNLPSCFGSPKETLEVAKRELSTGGVRILLASRPLSNPPVPASDQPWFENAVISVETDMSPFELMGLLQRIECDFGRQRSVTNEARVLDLDLLAYRDVCVEGSDLNLPHPRLHERSFVLEPLCEIAPNWIHPILHRSAEDLYQQYCIRKNCKQAG